MATGRIATRIVATLAFFGAVTGMYSAAYLAAGKRYDCGSGYGMIRTYRHEWQVRLFEPAAEVESRLTKQRVRVEVASWILDPCA